MRTILPAICPSILASPGPGLVGSWLKTLSNDHPYLYASLTVVLLVTLGLALGTVIEFLLSTIGCESKEIDYQE